LDISRKPRTESCTKNGSERGICEGKEIVKTKGGDWPRWVKITSKGLEVTAKKGSNKKKKKKSTREAFPSLMAQITGNSREIHFFLLSILVPTAPTFEECWIPGKKKGTSEWQEMRTLTLRPHKQSRRTK